VKIRVEASGELRLFPDQRMHAGQRLPMEFHQAALPVRVDEAECVNAEAFHRPVGTRNAAVAHRPDDVVLSLGVKAHEVPEGVVGGLRLRDLAIRMRFRRVDQVRELDSVLDEEHGHVVADEVERTLICIELDSESADVAGCVGRSARSDDRGEPDEDVRPSALL
jgi:hypothetical protein